MLWLIILFGSLISDLGVTFKGNAIGAYKVDLNVEADAQPEEDDEDDIDWEEG
jgi:hypothetical protein